MSSRSKELAAMALQSSPVGGGLRSTPKATPHSNLREPFKEVAHVADADVDYNFDTPLQRKSAPRSAPESETTKALSPQKMFSNRLPFRPLQYGTPLPSSGTELSPRGIVDAGTRMSRVIQDTSPSSRPPPSVLQPIIRPAIRPPAAYNVSSSIDISDLVSRPMSNAPPKKTLHLFSREAPQPPRVVTSPIENIVVGSTTPSGNVGAEAQRSPYFDSGSKKGINILGTTKQAVDEDHGRSPSTDTSSSRENLDSDAQRISAPPQHLLYHDCSGFQNAGNTCYASSVLTMLLRQERFQRELSTFMTSYGRICKTVYVRERRKVTYPPERRIVMRRRITRVRRGSAPNQPEEPLLSKRRLEPQWDVTAQYNQWESSVTETETALLGRENESVDDFTDAEVEEEVEEVHCRPPRIVEEIVKNKVTVCPLHHALLDAVNMLAVPQSVLGGINVADIADAMLPTEFCSPDGEPIEQYRPSFFDGDQHDAHEFLTAIFAQLEAEAMEAMKAFAWRRRRKEKKYRDALRQNGEGSASESSTDEDELTISPDEVWINDLFQGKFLSLISCRHEDCAHLQYSSQPFMNISVAIPKRTGAVEDDGGHPSLQEMIVESMRTEALEDYKCDKCASRANQCQGSCFTQLPKFLVTHIKRFSTMFHNGQVHFSKDRTQVKCDEEITVVVRNKDNASKPMPGKTVKRYRYRLRSLVMHQGDMLAGHYTSWFTRTEEQMNNSEQRMLLSMYDEGEGATEKSDAGCEKWLVANDSVVKEIPYELARQHTTETPLAYMALYEFVDLVAEEDVIISGDDSRGTPAAVIEHKKNLAADYHWMVTFPPLVPRSSSDLTDATGAAGTASREEGHVGAAESVPTLLDIPDAALTQPSLDAPTNSSSCDVFRDLTELMEAQQ